MMTIMVTLMMLKNTQRKNFSKKHFHRYTYNMYVPMYTQCTIPTVIWNTEDITAREIKLYVRIGILYFCLSFAILIHIHMHARCVGQIKRTIMPKWFQSNIIICQIDTNKTENVSVSHMFSINLKFSIPI